MVKNIFVNGPINVVRLEGSINKNSSKKIIYLFMDIHSDVDLQTECNDLNSLDIKNYFVNNFDNIKTNKKTYDFLFEIKPTVITKKTNNIRGRYIDQVVKFFKKEFIVDKKMVVSKSSQFPNIRLHCVDIRDYLRYTLNSNMYTLLNYITMIWKRLSINSHDFKMIRSNINLLDTRMKLLYNIFYNNLKVKNVKLKPMVPKTTYDLTKYTEQDYNIRVKNIIKKIKHSYHNKIVHDVINNFFNKNIKKDFKLYFESVSKLNTYLDNIFPKLKKYSGSLYIDKNNGAFYGLPPEKIRSVLYTIYNLVENFYMKWMNLHADIMDVYFLRRFLDKEYITNAITYTGIYHSINYIYMLVKYFDFEITHYSYMKYSPKDVTNKIKKSNSPNDINEFFYPVSFIQCSDLTNFPKNFD